MRTEHAGIDRKVWAHSFPLLPQVQVPVHPTACKDGPEAGACLHRQIWQKHQLEGAPYDGYHDAFREGL